MAETEPWKTDPDVAYAEAERRIATAIADGGELLEFHSWVLKALPPEIAKVTSLKLLDLGGTQIGDADLAHLSGLASLQRLYLRGTSVGDAGLAQLSGLTSLQVLFLNNTSVGDAGLGHLSGLTSLQELYLGGTSVGDAGLAHLSGLTSLQELYLGGTNQLSDLRPLLKFAGLLEPTDSPLHRLVFRGSAAARTEPLKSISEIRKNKVRTEALFAHLRTLPPYPLPIDGSAPEAQPASPLTQKETYQVAARPREYELESGPVPEADLGDPAKAAAYTKLTAARQRLLQGGNFHTDIGDLARALDLAMGATLAEADLPLLHMEVESAKHIHETRDERKEALEPELVTALFDVSKWGPFLTLDHPDVQRLEDAVRSYEHRDGDLVAHVAAMADLVRQNEAMFGELLRQVSENVVQLKDVDAPRTETAGAATVHNVLLAMLGALTPELVKITVSPELAALSAEFWIAHYTVICDLTATYGAQFHHAAKIAYENAKKMVGRDAE